MISATVEIEQRQIDGRTTVGTGFLVSDPTPDGRPRTVLVTAAHVLERMQLTTAKIGYRAQSGSDKWRYAPELVAIRDGNKPLWRRDPDQDVAVIEVKAPEAFAKAAIPMSWLAGDDTLRHYGVGPGDEMMVLGYPQGLSANTAGFPILRSGRVASPIEAPDANPAFLLDFRVFPGNSGGPVFLARAAGEDGEGANVVAGMLTEQVEVDEQRLEIGVVTDAQFIRNAIALLDKPETVQTALAAPAKAAPPASMASAMVGQIAAD
jgi:S1-C subfamily serine protease